MKILDHRQIQHKIERLTIEILENNFEEPEIILAGINNNGYEFARLLSLKWKELSPIPCLLTRIRLNPAAPLSSEIQVEMPVEQMDGKVVIVVDDVTNTGRTVFYACKPILSVLPKKIEVAVLVDRKHKSFPIHVDYVGLSLATTLKENIEVHIHNVKKFEVLLD